MTDHIHDELYSSAVALLAQVETRSKNGGNVDLLAGAALDLCLEIAHRREWWVVVEPDGEILGHPSEYSAMFVEWNWEKQGRFERLYHTQELEAQGDTPAEALARLALAALEATR